MDERVCSCGVTYTPKDAYAIKRHEASAKHLYSIPASRKEKDEVTEPTTDIETFSDLDLDDEPEPVVEKPKAKRKPKAVAPASATKVCRVCSVDKPLEEYRVKSSRPDGRDTICAVCSKAWLVAHLAKKAGAK
jgi:hypothetical protein